MADHKAMTDWDKLKGMMSGKLVGAQPEKGPARPDPRALAERLIRADEESRAKECLALAAELRSVPGGLAALPEPDRALVWYHTWRSHWNLKHHALVWQLVDDIPAALPAGLRANVLSGQAVREAEFVEHDAMVRHAEEAARLYESAGQARQAGIMYWQLWQAYKKDDRDELQAPVARGLAKYVAALGEFDLLVIAATQAVKTAARAKDAALEAESIHWCKTLLADCAQKSRRFLLENLGEYENDATLRKAFPMFGERSARLAAFAGAARAGDVGACEALAASMRDVDEVSADKDAPTALLAAAAAGKAGTVRWLLSRGASHRLKNWGGRTALHLASRSAGGADAAAALLAAGADPDAVDDRAERAIPRS